MANLSAREILQTYKSPVWKTIQSYLTSPRFPPQFDTPENYRFMEQLHWQIAADYPRRQGKYLRPTLLLLAAEGLGMETDKVLRVAAAMQLSEDWILIHDDFEDDSDFRRGKPTLHKIHSPELAVNAGDALHVICWKALIDSHRDLGWEITSRLLDEFYTILIRTTIGQTVEIKWFQENKLDISDADWYFIANSKVSYYTIAGPLRLGAIAAGASPLQLDTLTDFGLHLGYCFQIVDDLLDLTCDFAGLKKQLGNDVYEGKRTVMLGHLLRSIEKSQAQKLHSILSKDRQHKTPGDIDWVIARMEEAGSLDYARKVAESEKSKAVDILKNRIDFLSGDSYSKLNTLCEFILNRDH